MVLFTYGSLELPEIMQAATRRTFPRRAAVLEGYRCRRVLTSSRAPLR